MSIKTTLAIVLPAIATVLLAYIWLTGGFAVVRGIVCVTAAVVALAALIFVATKPRE